MVLQSIETPRKVNDLGASIAAGALLLSPGLVGMLTGRPARIALQPLDGTAGTAVDLSIESAQEIALLSKDAAVVLAGGGALWSLLDLRGTVKVRQIAQDARALHARPQGESALAIGTDGQAMALTLSRTEVGVRTLSVRGALRACDVGDQVTYALLDGEGGGQLRVHPGATPELGTSARATLPDAALGLDRVRGGQLLSAVYKRNDERVCLVQGGSKLEARLVRLDAKPADVAVLDGCLLVAFVDGRLALYDPDALARAGDGPLEPTSVVPLGGQGRPRVLLATAGKGAPALWIGTTTGEVVRAALVQREVEAASSRPAATSAPATMPVPASAPPSGPSPAETIAARDLEIEELKAENARLVSEHAAERDALRVEHARALEEQSAASAQAAEEQSAAHARALEEQSATHAKALAERDAAHARALEEQGAAGARSLEELKGAHARELDEQRAVSAMAVAELNGAHAKALEDQGAAHARGVDELKTAHAKALEEAHDRRKTAEERAASLEGALRAKDDDLSARTAERDRLQAELAARGDDLSARTSERDALQAQLTAGAEERDALRSELAARSEERDALRSELAARTADLERHAGDRDGLQAELDAARGRAAAAEKQLAILTVERDERAREQERMRLEVDRLLGDLAREHERIQKVFPFGSDGLSSVERARERLDAMVAQVQGLFFRRPRD